MEFVDILFALKAICKKVFDANKMVAFIVDDSNGNLLNFRSRILEEINLSSKILNSEMRVVSMNRVGEIKFENFSKIRILKKQNVSCGMLRGFALDLIICDCEMEEDTLNQLKCQLVRDGKLYMVRS